MPEDLDGVVLTMALGVSTVKTPLVRLSLSALELLFPPQCFGCGRYGTFLCPSCQSSLSPLKPPYCRRCAQPIGRGGLCRQCVGSPPGINGISSPYLMESAIREAIHGLKYRTLRAAAPSLGKILSSWLEANPLPGDVLVPVPLHKRRLRDRGYNQSALLAREVGKRTGLPVLEDVLVRTRDTRPQVSLSREDRSLNVVGSFECVGSVKDGRFILVDDVVTTGSTMSACALALRAGGASDVWGLTLAKTMGL